MNNKKNLLLCIIYVLPIKGRPYFTKNNQDPEGRQFMLIFPCPLTRQHRNAGLLPTHLSNMTNCAFSLIPFK